MESQSNDTEMLLLTLLVNTNKWYRLHLIGFEPPVASSMSTVNFIFSYFSSFCAIIVRFPFSFLDDYYDSEGRSPSPARTPSPEILVQTSTVPLPLAFPLLPTVRTPSPELIPFDGLIVAENSLHSCK